MPSLLLQFTGATPLFRMIDFLVENKGLDFSKTEIAKGAGISRASAFNHWNTLERAGIVKTTRAFGKAKLYMIDTQSPVTRKLLELEQALIAQELHRQARARQPLSEQRRKPRKVSA